jgi:hypothetical protein
MSIKSISTRRISAQSVESGSTISFNVDNGNTYISGAYVNSSSNAHLQIITTGSAANNVPLKIVPIVSTISVANSSYGVLDDTAVDIAGGYLVINGQNFTSTCAVYLGATLLSSTFVSKTQLRAVVPATAAGSYSVSIVDGTVAAYYASLSVSAFPNWTSDSYTTTSLTVSVQLLASGDAPLTFSLISGTLPSGLSLSSSGLISGTVDASSTTTGLVFQVDDAQLQSTQVTATLVIINADPYWKNTAISLQSQITAFTDVSNTAANPTIAGDTRAAVFSPFGDRRSVYFNGSSSSLSASNATAFDQDINFTVEMWVMAHAYPGGAGNHVFLYRPNSSDSLALGLDLNGKIVIDDQRTGAIGTSTATINRYLWYHVALVRNGPTTSNVLLFINGALDTTVSYSGWTTAATGVQIGSRTDVPRNLSGYISSLRVTKNALYTAAFTPTRGALAPITNTVFLACQSNTIIDVSNSAISITANTSTTANTQYGGTYQSYSAPATGSVFFDGSGDYITFPDNAAYEFGNSNFTVEMWVFPTALPAEAVLASKWNAGGTAGTNQWIFSLNSGVPVFTCSTDGSSVAANASGNTIITNAWTHLAAVRNGSSLAVYVNGANGTVNTSLSTSTLYSAESEVLGISYRRNNGSTAFPFTGYISNLRITKGQAIYTSAFTTTVPSATLSATANTSLLVFQYPVHYNNTKILDSSPNDYTITRTTGGYLSTFSPAGNNRWGIWANGGNGGVLSPVANAVLGVGTGDFTFEAWAYPLANSGIKFIASTGAAGTGTWQIGVNTAISSGQLRIFKENNTQLFNDTTANLTFNAWNHVALVRSGANTGVYVNGTLANTIADSTNYSNTTLNIAAGNTSSGQTWLGYLSNVRLVKGNAVYTSNFTPPSQPLTNVFGTNTSLLICNGPSNLDKGPNALAITGRTFAYTVAFGPFSDTVEYSISNTGGSVFFDNSTNYLSIASNTNLTPGAEDFTYEGWIWSTDLASTTADVLWDATGGVAGTTIKIQASLSGGTPGYLYYANNANRITSGNSNLIIKQNEWQHLAISRASGTTRMFVNGVQQGGNYVDSFTYTAAGITMGRDFGAATNYFGGNISGWRFVKGRGLYTANFTPDTTPVGPIPGTQFLMSGTSGAVKDLARGVVPFTNFNAKSTSQRKFGNTSLAFDGTGDYVDFNIGNQIPFVAPYDNLENFTIEAWIYPQTVSKLMTIFDSRAALSNAGIELAMQANGQLYSTIVAGGALFGGVTGIPTLNSWNHVAIVKNNGNSYLYMNGNLLQSNTTSYVVSGRTYKIGTYYGAIGDDITNKFQGYIDEVRITPGVARYTGSTYVVPTIRAFPY